MPPLGFGCSGQAAGRGSRQGRACRTWHHTQAWTSQLSLPDARRCRNNGHRLRGPSHSQTGHRKTAHELQLECRTERALAGGCPVLSCAVRYYTYSTCSGSLQNRDLVNKILLPSIAGRQAGGRANRNHAPCMRILPCRLHVKSTYS